jgi:hypothetical protein
MKFDSIPDLKAEGFVGFTRIGELMAGQCHLDGCEKGFLLLVTYTKKVHPEFLRVGTGGPYKEGDPNVRIETLESAWVEGALVVYIGCTSRTLNERIEELIKFGQGQKIGHGGGRYLWQISDSRELCVGWKPLPDDKDPKQEKRCLLREFRKEYGKPPFANLKG